MGVIQIGFVAGGKHRAMLMDLDDTRSNEAYILRYIGQRMHYEPDVSNALAQLVREGDLVVDVGANVGFFTTLAATLTGPTGRVVSFEPGDNNLDRLKNNVAINKFEHVTVIEQPAIDAPGDVTFFINSDDSGGNALWNPGEHHANPKSAAAPRPITMQGTSVDAEIERLGLPAPRVIKIDTEGAELTVLKGCRNLLTERRTPFVIAEYHPFGLDKMGTSPQELRAFMASFGYSAFFLYYDGSLPRLVPLETEITAPCIINLLYATPEDVGRMWKTAWHDPGTALAQPAG